MFARARTRRPGRTRSAGLGPLIPGRLDPGSGVPPRRVDNGSGDVTLRRDEQGPMHASAQALARPSAPGSDPDADSATAFASSTTAVTTSTTGPLVDRRRCGSAIIDPQRTPSQNERPDHEQVAEESEQAEDDGQGEDHEVPDALAVLTGPDVDGRRGRWCGAKRLRPSRALGESAVGRSGGGGGSPRHLVSVLPLDVLGARIGAPASAVCVSSVVLGPRMPRPAGQETKLQDPAGADDEHEHAAEERREQQVHTEGDAPVQTEERRVRGVQVLEDEDHHDDERHESDRDERPRTGQPRRRDAISSLPVGAGLGRLGWHW